MRQPQPRRISDGRRGQRGSRGGRRPGGALGSSAGQAPAPAPPVVVALPVRLSLFDLVAGPAPPIADLSEAPCTTYPQPLPGLPQPEQSAPCNAVEPIIGQVWLLARSPGGCRTLQIALEAAESDEARCRFAREMRGHIREALRCPNANHVVQKCIVTMRPQALQFIIDEIRTDGPRGGARAARQVYGCRVLQRLLEHCPPDQVAELVGDMLAEAIRLSVHQFGNYVMQRLVEHGTGEQRTNFMSALRRHPKTVGSSLYGCAVLGKALTHGAHHDQAELALALAGEEGLAARMARTRHGHLVVERMLQVVGPEDLEALRRQLLESEDQLRESRYGRSIVVRLVAGGWP